MDRIRDFLCRGMEIGGSTIGKTLGKGSSAVAGATAVQAYSNWLVSGETVILNFLKKSMPRKEPANAAHKNFFFFNARQHIFIQ
jgi:hypothetical protein